MAAINALMLLSTPFMGHHYVTDIIAGTAITVIAIIAYRIATAPACERSGLSVAAQPAMAVHQTERW